MDILNEFAREAPFPIRIQRNPERMGHENNFLETARRCQGDLIAFSDQDDVWRANKLEKCRTYFNTPNVLLVMHSASVVDADLKPLGHMFPELTHTQTAPARHVYPWRPAPGFAMLFSSRIVRDFSWHDRPDDMMSRDKRPLGHDHWVLAIANLLGEVVLLAEDLTLHRRHTKNTTGKMEAGTKRMLREGVKTGGGTYQRQSEIALSYAEYIQGLARQAVGEDARAFHAGVAYYRDWANKLALRANLHSRQSRLAQRAKIFSELMRLEVYRKDRDNGGFGKRAFLKDMLCTFM